MVARSVGSETMESMEGEVNVTKVVVGLMRDDINKTVRGFEQAKVEFGDALSVKLHSWPGFSQSWPAKHPQ